MLYPILHWTEKEVWEFIKEMQLPVNPCYNRGGRVGCMFCPFSKRREIEYYEKKYPKIKEIIIQRFSLYLQHRSCQSAKSGLTRAEDYYEWWKSKKTLKKYVAEQRQYEIDFEL